ncbi:MAG: sarcosine oxidase subunit alpha family protein [Pseudomonadota bacterium]
MSGYRLATAGRIDRSKPISFRFDNTWMKGFEGDTLASALLANGVSLVGRSFKYHRPRGIFSDGSDEPNALVTIGEGAAATPNTRATMVPLTQGLVASSQNWRGSLKWDLMSVNDIAAPFLSAGFYYKTFMWPKAFWEKVYEPFIRSSAGLGVLSEKSDGAVHASGWKHCDVLVIGAGPSGLMAALTLGRTGARVIVADEADANGGRLARESLAVGDELGADWAVGVRAELDSLPNVEVLPRTTVWGVYDEGLYGALERTERNGTRGTHWRIRAKHSILAAGATERPIAFPGNDRPGVMLASAARGYANHEGVAVGRRVAVWGNNDNATRTAKDLKAAGVRVVAELDTRKGDEIVRTKGRHGLREIFLSDDRRIEADALAISGGWSPNVHLTCHHRGRPVWDEERAAFLPGPDLPPGMACAGAVTGAYALSDALRQGAEVGSDIAEALGKPAPRLNVPEAEDDPREVSAFWQVKAKGRAWVDMQNDVTSKDIVQAQAEGFVSVEHAKRYTTLGMATDQGKTGNVLGLALLAEATGRTIPETGTTIFRPPYTPIPMGAMAGTHRGQHFQPLRKTPSHAWAKEQGAVFTEAGLWLRAQYFPQPGETHWRQSVDREVIATRRGVGICDVSTLGKIDVQGRDAAAFLNFVYANGFAKLAVGKTRYGLMLREDGFAFDDGTCARLSENRYMVTTTTANAGSVLRHMEFVRQCLCPEMDVHLISVTDAWAQYAVAGPQSRALLQKVIDEDISNEGFPFMACKGLDVAGVPGRLFRISFSGELAYEVAVPTRYGDALIRRLMELGAPMGVVPYGTEALGVMRIEKGHAAGGELNGQTTAGDLGLGRMVSTKKDSIGTVSSKRPALEAGDRPALVGLVPVNKTAHLQAGAHILPPKVATKTANDQGWVSSACHSPTLGHDIALGFLKGGMARAGETLVAWDGIRGVQSDVTVVSPHFYDPEGERLRV